MKRLRNYFIVALILLWGGCFSAFARQITDMTGRRVTVPDVIRKVYGTSPPATFMVYAVDPAMLAGLNFPLNPAQKQFLAPVVDRLPVIGGQPGQGRTPNLETLLQVRPDVVLVWVRQQLSAVNEKFGRSLKPLGIPLVYMTMDSLNDYPAAFRFLGELLDRQERTQALSRYAEASLAQAARVRAAIPEAQRVSVYYAEGPNGLSTECHTSLHAELIPLCGAANVHQCQAQNARGMQKISMEQILRYDPEVIVYYEPSLHQRFAGDPRWQNIRAVKDGRIYGIPTSPFNWFDRPPSFMRLLGLKWVAHHLYPGVYPIDLCAETQLFFKLFLNVSLDKTTAQALLQP